jgi:hypothetical protein
MVSSHDDGVGLRLLSANHKVITDGKCCVCLGLVGTYESTVMLLCFCLVSVCNYIDIDAHTSCSHLMDLWTTSTTDLQPLHC